MWYPVAGTTVPYLRNCGTRLLEQWCNSGRNLHKTIFVDDYVGVGYGKESTEIEKIIIQSMLKYGIPMDSTYTGKAFLGMKKYIAKNRIKDKNVLFIHTGGTPLFFDDLKKMKN